jgi:uncharacterized protein YfiM (DUF2279 family)
MIMRKSGYTIILVTLFLAFACDIPEGAFEESLPDFYTLTTQVSPAEGGIVAPSGGEHLSGKSVQMEAVPAEGYVFDHWEGDMSGNSNPEFIRFNSNKTVTAYFSPREYNLNIDITGSGVVREVVVEQSSSITVRLEAEADEGWFFDRWEGDLSGNSNPVNITLDEDEEKSVKAIFIENLVDEYSLKISVAGEGTIERNPEKTSYTDGEEVTLTANAASGWSFKEWNGDLSGSKNPATITFDKNKSVTAIFEQNVSDEYNLSIKTEGEGLVDRNPDNSYYTEGEEVTLTANPASGWSFKEWQGDLSGNTNPITITVDENKQVTAIFEEDAELGISIYDAKLFIKEMGLEGARRTRDFEIKDFILSLPLDGSPFEITHVQIPAGFYEELELKIDRPGSSAEIVDSDFVDGSNSFSLVVNGIFNGVDFIFKSTEDFQMKADLEPNLEINSGQTSVIVIKIDFESWFRGRDGEFLDPNDSRNAKRINDNIEDSFSDFEDGF